MTSPSPRRRAAAALLLALLAPLGWMAGDPPARADPASTIQTLMIVDEGDFLSFQWSFYYVDFPRHFALKEKGGKLISLDDPATLYDNLSDIVSVAFDLRLDGRPVAPDKISRLAIAPNKVCIVTMIYRGRPGGQVELRAPVLQYLPPIAMINYEIVSLGRPANVVSGNLMGHPGPFPQLITYRESGLALHSSASSETTAAILFKSQLRTAWINSNWILIVLVLLLAGRTRQVVAPVLGMIAGWIALALVASRVNLGTHATLPGWMAALPTVLLGVLAARRTGGRPALLAAGGGAALLNALLDLQQIRWSPEEQTATALAGLGGGFACGLCSVALVLGAIVHECRKYREFSSQWAPRLCWLVAALALLLPLQRLFGQ